ncbi:hypothetical protein ACFL6Y_10795 [Elusimicrobiota bacterium]
MSKQANEVYYYDKKPAWLIEAEDPASLNEAGCDVVFKFFKLEHGAVIANITRIYDDPEQPLQYHRAFDLNDPDSLEYLEKARDAGSLVVICETGKEEDLRWDPSLKDSGLGAMITAGKRYNDDLDEPDGDAALRGFNKVFDKALKDTEDCFQAWEAVGGSKGARKAVILQEQTAGGGAWRKWVKFGVFCLVVFGVFQLYYAMKNYPPKNVNKDMYPSVVGPGDTTRINVGESIQTVGGHWRGVDIVFDAVVEGKKVVALVSSADIGWGIMVFEKTMEGKSPHITPYIELTVPNDKSLAGKVLEGKLSMTVRYPAPVGNTGMETKSMDIKEDISIRIFTSMEKFAGDHAKNVLFLAIGLCVIAFYAFALMITTH